MNEPFPRSTRALWGKLDSQFKALTGHFYKVSIIVRMDFSAPPIQQAIYIAYRNEKGKWNRRRIIECYSTCQKTHAEGCYDVESQSNYIELYQNKMNVRKMSSHTKTAKLYPPLIHDTEAEHNNNRSLNWHKSQILGL